MANKIRISEQAENNLRKLADYLLKGDLKCDFDMQDFVCGTAACAVGHGPDAGIPKAVGVPWHEYIADGFGFDGETDSYYWCFSACWCVTDNTPQGAAKRILYMLDYGVPGDYEAQMWGRKELCYK